MSVPSKMSDLFTLAASNSPAGSDLIGNTLDDYIRSHAAIIRSTNALSSASIASASTTDLSTSDGEQVTITGAATINSLGTLPSGIVRELSFSGACTITNSSAIVLPFGANIATTAGDIYTFRSLGSGNWVMTSATKGAYLPLSGGTLSGALTVNSTVTSTGTITANGTFQSSTNSSILATGSAGSVSLRPNGSASTAGQFYVDPNGNIGVGTVPTSAGGVGNPVTGASNIVAYNPGNIGLYLCTDNAAARAHQLGFAAAGISQFDAGLGYNTGTRNLSLFAGSSARVVVDQTGNVGVGAVPTAVPSIGNPVLGGNNIIGYNAGNIGLTLLTDNATTRISQIGFGSAGIGTFDAGMAYSNATRTLTFITGSASHMTLDTSGICTATDFKTSSDTRLKDNIKPLSRGVAELKQMPPQEYVKEGRKEIGHIAQMVQKVVPEAVGQREDGMLTVSYSQLVALLSACILELDERLSAVEKR